MPQRNCNPLPLPDQPACRLDRAVSLDNPVAPAKPGLWRPERLQPYRQYAGSSAPTH